MVEEILAVAGIQERGSRHIKPPAGTYAVWFDTVTADGPDGVPPRIFTHDITVELYASKPDPDAEAKLGAAIGAQGFDYVMHDRTWITTEQKYITPFEFSYIETRRT